MNNNNRILARALIVSMVCLGLPVPAAHAELVATGAVYAGQPAGIGARERIASLLDREEVRAGLESYGVSVADAKARVAALSDDEIQRVAARMDEVPAGAGAVETLLVVGFLAFVILLITDILGFTKVFNFTRTAK